ncbi:hypothetical protein [Phaffia rhodozyma]|uniref:Uncharacterized protein n=1 Tax=Phaffia rhodozyma TaxID=264483 RepID=A0A0F7STA3_PHARH|nr:hypothetical protein [Phaffia rhodozyma]
MSGFLSFVTGTTTVPRPPTAPVVPRPGNNIANHGLTSGASTNTSTSVSTSPNTSPGISSHSTSDEGEILDSRQPRRSGSQPPSRTSTSTSLSTSHSQLSNHDQSFQAPNRVSTSDLCSPSGPSQQSIARKDGGSGSKKKARKPAAFETLIFVRPPPTSKAHPLNFQCQLVAPSPPTPNPRRTSINSLYPITSRQSTAPSVQSHRLSSHDATTPAGEYPPTDPNSNDVEELETPEDHALSRSPSVKSTNSVISTSTSGTIGGSSGLKRIVPLYNLNCHTVIACNISDAGTDAKVARFFKRNLEISSFGSLEPIEHWPPLPSSNTLQYQPLSSTSLAVYPASPQLTSTRKLSTSPSDTGSPRISLESTLSAGALDELNRGPLGMQENGGTTKRFLGKLFRKTPSKNGPRAGGERAVSSSGNFFSSFSLGEKEPRTSSEQRARSSRSSFTAPLSAAVTEAVNEAVVGGGSNKRAPYLGAPTLGTSPIVKPPLEGMKTSGRPSAYIWIVSKWATPGDVWSFAAISNTLPSFSHSPIPSPSDTSFSIRPPANNPDPRSLKPVSLVRFEWVRGRSSSTDKLSADCNSRPTSTRRVSASNIAASLPSQSSAGPATPPRRVSSQTERPSSSPNRVNLPGASNALRPYSSSLRSNVTPSPKGEVNLQVPESPSSNRGRPLSSPLDDDKSEPAEAEDEDEDDDPEDSETPWLCYITRISSVHAISNGAGIGNSGLSTDRILLGKLSPAPHHPKILAQLRMPYPMNPFPVEGINDSGFLSADQLKDVVCSTAMFLLVRESWGGLGKKKKDAAVRKN